METKKMPSDLTPEKIEKLKQGSRVMFITGYDPGKTRYGTIEVREYDGEKFFVDDRFGKEHIDCVKYLFPVKGFCPMLVFVILDNITKGRCPDYHGKLKPEGEPVTVNLRPNPVGYRAWMFFYVTLLTGGAVFLQSSSNDSRTLAVANVLVIAMAAFRIAKLEWTKDHNK